MVNMVVAICFSHKVSSKISIQDPLSVAFSRKKGISAKERKYCGEQAEKNLRKEFF